MTMHEVAGSFRDPSGYLYRDEGRLLRHVDPSYAPHYDQLMAGLYDELTRAGLLVQHQEVQGRDGAYRTLAPDVVPFVSYPYEWSFMHWRSAALATLDILEAALRHGMVLKDATAFNIQFVPGAPRPVLIDTLSFETYEEGKPWVAYRQFVRHFLAPLALMAKVDVRLGQWLATDPDGFPLDMASRLLPRSTRWNPGLALHLHMMARFEGKYADADVDVKQRSVSRNGLMGLIGSLRRTVDALRWRPGGTEWGEYYKDTNYTEAGFEAKGRIVAEWLRDAAPTMVWDLGANTGVFSRIAADAGATVLAFDKDEDAVERHARAVAESGHAILPLLWDLARPSPGIGWDNTERDTVPARGRADVVMALALVHHLAIGHNVPLPRVAATLARLGDRLIIEWVPKEDSQVQRLLRNRADVFDGYTEKGFRDAIGRHFRIVEERPIPDSVRRMFLLEAV